MMRAKLCTASGAPVQESPGDRLSPSPAWRLGILVPSEKAEEVSVMAIVASFSGSRYIIEVKVE
jgi:hypothetical protein